MKPTTGTLIPSSSNTTNSDKLKDFITPPKQPQKSNQSESAGSQRRRSKVLHACVYCQRSHMTCDQGRPCQRCVRRRIGHLCHDVPPIGIATLVAPADGNTSSDGPFLSLPVIVGGINRVNPTSAERSLPLASSASTPQHSTALVDNEFQNNRYNVPTTTGYPARPLKPINPQQAYQELAHFCEELYSSEGQARIFHSIARIRDACAAFVRENGQEREYDRLLAAISTPTIIVRRSGEVLRVNSAFASLIRIPAIELLGHWRFYQLMTEEAHINFAERVAELFLETSVGSVIMACTLVTGGLRHLLEGGEMGRGRGGKASISSTGSESKTTPEIELVMDLDRITTATPTTSLSTPKTSPSTIFMSANGDLDEDIIMASHDGQLPNYSSSIAKIDGRGRLINCSLAVTIRRDQSNFPIIIVITVIPSPGTTL